MVAIDELGAIVASAQTEKAELIALLTQIAQKVINGVILYEFNFTDSCALISQMR